MENPFTPKREDTERSADRLTDNRTPRRLRHGGNHRGGDDFGENGTARRLLVEIYQRRIAERFLGRGMSVLIVSPREDSVMYYLYASQTPGAKKLVATFDTEEQLLAYVGWATLRKNPDGSSKFEQGSALVGYQWVQRSDQPLTDEDSQAVTHNPSSSML